MRARALWAVMAAWLSSGLAGPPPMPPPSRVPCSRLRTGGRHRHADEVRWDLRVTDHPGRRVCAYAKLEIDVDNGIDPDFRSDNACPGAPRWPSRHRCLTPAPGSQSLPLPQRRSVSAVHYEARRA